MATESETNGQPRRPRARLRVAGMRAVLVGTVGAFAGGALVVGLQVAVAHFNARYPPIVQSVQCDLHPGQDDAPLAALDMTALPGGMRLPEVTAGTDIVCRLDAPGADYAAWSFKGDRLIFRAGPLDGDLPCQDASAFGGQDSGDLRVSACQRFHISQPGVHQLLVKVMARGLASLDSAELRLLARPPAAAEVLPVPPVPPDSGPEAPEPEEVDTQPVAPAPEVAQTPAAPTPPPPAAPAAPTVATVTLGAALLVPARSVQMQRTIPVSESLAEHGLLPTSRDFSRVVYRLAPYETYRDASFEASSAEHASNTRVAWDGQRKAVTLSFTLRSGPLIDRWRGWLSGSVLVRLRRDEPARRIDLPDIALPVPGRLDVPLPGSDAVPAARTLRLAPAGGAAVEVPIGGTARLGDATVGARLDGRLLILETQAAPAG